MKSCLKVFSGVAILFLISICMTIVYYTATLPDSFELTKGSTLKIQSMDRISSTPVFNSQEVQTSNSDEKPMLQSSTLRLFGVIPIKTVEVSTVETKLLVPSGEPFGIKLNMDGVMVVGIGEVASTENLHSTPAKDGGIQKGDIIVSGLIYRNDNIVDMVKSSADVYAEVWYKVKLKTSYYINKKSITNKKRYYYIEIMGKKFNILGFYKDINKENKKTLYKGSFVSIGINDRFIYKNKKYRYNKNDLKKYLEDKALSSIKKNLNDNEKILEQKTLKTYSKNDKMYIEVFFKTYENIAMEEKAEIIEKEG